jgi:hypothetical protein
MMRRVAILLLICGVSATQTFAAEIREFSVSTLERLGNELSRRDEIAARAADLAIERDPKWKKVSPQYWITDLGKGSDTVYLIDARKPEPAVAYKISFPKGGSRGILEAHHQPLPPGIALRYKALRTAVKAALPTLNTAYDPRYNWEVLNDPDGSGFLVYALAAFTKKNLVYTGGHVRITVSADGAKVERIDQLSHWIIEQKSDPGHEVVAMAVAQAVETRHPVETFLYESHLSHLPFYVATNDGSSWRVVNRKIYKFTKAEMDAAESKPEKKKK